MELIAELIADSTGARHPLVVAAELLAQVGGLPGLVRAGASEALSLSSLGPVGAGRLSRALELALRLRSRAVEASLGAIDFAAAAAWGTTRLGHLAHEELWVLCVDSRLRLLCSERVAQGGPWSCGSRTADVLRVPVRVGASAFVLIHNHPSGDPTPSAADRHVSAQLTEAARLVGIPLLDHVVVTSGGAQSVGRGLP